MARPRKWESDAERMRAKRGVGSPAEEAPAASSTDLVPTAASAESSSTALVPRTVTFEGRRWPIVREPPLSEAAYIAEHVLATKLAVSGGLKDHDGQRVERAKEYARWRYRGYLAGEVATL